MEDKRKLDDEELEQVSGGEENFSPSGADYFWRFECCGNTWETNDAFSGGSCPTCGERGTNGRLVRIGNKIIE